LRFPRADADEGERTLRRSIRAFLAGQEFVPRCDNWLSGFDAEFSHRLGSAGFIGISIPQEYGGGGCSALARFIVSEELLAAGAPVGAHWIADRQTAPLLLRYGTEEQKQRFLPAIAQGTCFFVIGMSEPSAGSDLASVRTVAAKVGDGYRINGQKVWTTNAHRSHFMVALCRTERADPDPHQGLSQLIIPLEADGVDVRPIETLDGAPHFAEVFLNDVFVSDEMVVGTPGSGWKQVMSELAYERSGPERLLSTFPLLVELVRATERNPNTLGFASIGRAIARLQALRGLSRGVAIGLDRGDEPSIEAAIVKELGTRQEKQLIELVRDATDTEEMLSDARLKQLFDEVVLRAPAFTLRGGTNEILRNIIARGLGAG
jgi:alkylation response protein AidB-like acyl-CoA dehydrogenase